MNLSNNSELLNNIDENFPLGTALKVKIKSVDNEKHNVVLTARDDEITSFEDITVGQKLPARVLRVSESSVWAELAENVKATSYLTDALDDYSEKLNEVFSANDIIPAVVLSVDQSNKKISISLRSEKAKDKLIRTSSDLNRGDVVRGFVKNVYEKGLFVSLGSNVTAYVRITDLSDTFLKDWKKFFKLNQLVTGKVTNVNKDGNVTLTLKDSEVKGGLNILKNFDELKVGEIFEGSVRKVTDYGVFVNLDGASNISGLAHHSQISDNSISNLSALFGEGDRVKVKILTINSEKKQLSLGMKASYFEENDVEMKDSDQEDSSDEEYEDAEDIEVDDSEAEQLDEKDFDHTESDSEDSQSESEEKEREELSGLGTNGFDWTAKILDQVQDDDSSDEEDFTQVKSKKKKSSKKIVEDRTGDIKSKAPQSVADFERLIIGNPNSSIVWMNYMSFQLQLSEIEKAREIGERALKTINYREEQEKLNIWIALLNLENTFGTTETLEDVFKRSTEYMDSLTMHQKLVSIYILSEKFDKSDALFKTITKKFGKSSVAVWVSYGEYLLDRDEHTKAHETLASALAALPKRDHVEVVRKFGQLEFKKGDPEQGRTLFEGLIADVPKRIDLWNVYIDQEIKKEEKKKAEELFERVLQRKITRKQAKFFFGKWLELEEKNEDAKGADYVKAKAQQYVSNQ
jgi:rRNA biogenesis protein RRP5